LEEHDAAWQASTTNRNTHATQCTPWNMEHATCARNS
jgi:hypothetical protein